MSNELVSVGAEPTVVSVILNDDEYLFAVATNVYEYLISADEYVFTVSTYEFYHPALRHNNRRNSMYRMVLPIF